VICVIHPSHPRSPSPALTHLGLFAVVVFNFFSFSNHKLEP
jgi:hypothetical protein